MSAKDHPSYSEEIKWLDFTLDYLKGYYKTIAKEKLRLDNEVEYGLRHYNSDNAEQFNDLILNTTLKENIDQKIKDLDKAKLKPYFARVDFKDGKTSRQEKFYFGKASLIRKEDNEFIVVDWRAPVANLYYEGRLGKASYKSPDGLIQGEINLKRQYDISNSNLNEIFDIDITTNDDFLQACLGSNKDNRLKDIVSTIQAEQNRVIRADLFKPLIVQGAAGGGKTTIALHRIAYLLYNYEKSFSPKNFMIIAPSKFFLSYISEVLPELGVENVAQTTFEDLAFEIIDHKFKIKDPYEKISILLDKSINNDYKKSIKDLSNFKTSMKLKQCIDEYMKAVELDFIPKKDFEICGYTLIPYESLQNLFINEYKSLPFMKRINEIKKHLVNTLRLLKKDILVQIENEGDQKINDLRSSMDDCEKRRNLIIDAANERDQLIAKIKRLSSSLVRTYLSSIKPLTPLDYYKDLLSKIGGFTYSFSDKIFSEGFIETEDLAPLMYIKYLVYGLDDKLSIRHIVIDEAQDLGIFQFYVLKKLISTSSFTILGDLCQGIHSYRGINNWEDISKYVFEEHSPSFLTLEQSYRTTIEIMNSASKVISNIKSFNTLLPKPVIRHGEAVKIEEKASLSDIAQEIKNILTDIPKEGFKSTALICKTMDECLKLKAILKKLRITPKLITGNDKEYSGGVVLVPAYLAKGLEFDVVVIVNASSSVYENNELDTKLLYVAMTRPIHRLYIYSVGKRASMLT